MAGSFNHIVNRDGGFGLDLIENLGDAAEALEECYRLIYVLSSGNTASIRDACQKLNIVDPWDVDEDGNSKHKMYVDLIDG